MCDLSVYSVQCILFMSQFVQLFTCSSKKATAVDFKIQLLIKHCIQTCHMALQSDRGRWAPLACRGTRRMAGPPDTSEPYGVDCIR